MSQQRHQGERGTSWRTLVLAAGGAAGVLLLLLASVGLIWLVGRSPTSAPALGAQPPPTPTPRSLAFLQETPTPSAEAQQPDAASTSINPTPALLASPNDERSSAAGDGVVFSAPETQPFATFASGSWDATADALRNDGVTADAEPWLKLASVPGAAFAIEAEIRVNGVLDTFCDQSFGLAGGSASAGKAYGAGVLFPCAGGDARARLTDVSVWEDGYHADPLIAENAFDPGNDWRTYRFEIRGNAARLIVDGVGILNGTLDPSTAAESAEAGVWSQGVELEIRRIEIYPLPPS